MCLNINNVLDDFGQLIAKTGFSIKLRVIESPGSLQQSKGIYVHTCIRRQTLFLFGRERLTS